MSTFHTSRRGVASVETVIVLPVFIIAFASVFYVRNVVTAKQAAESKARTCAWLYSAANCDRSALTPECAEVLQDTSNAGSLVDPIKKELNRARITPIDQVITSVLDPIVEAVFGSGVNARVSTEYERPPIYGGGRGTAIASYHLACNVERRTITDVAREAWDAIF